jgi:uncharacterized membrane protein
MGEAARTEAFTDGIFAVAMTILVLELHDPGQTLPGSLGQMWPHLLAYFVSFATLLIMWVNHHAVFIYVRRVEPALLFTNGLCLLFVTLVPFSTGLVADHMDLPDAHWAGAVYALTWAAYGLTGFPFWWALRRASLNHAGLKGIQRNIWISFLVYLAAAGIAFVSVIGSILAVLAVTAFWTFESFRRHAAAPKTF